MPWITSDGREYDGGPIAPKTRAGLAPAPGSESGYYNWAEAFGREEACYYCGKWIRDWADPEWAPGRICRECETEHEPKTPNS